MPINSSDDITIESQNIECLKRNQASLDAIDKYKSREKNSIDLSNTYQAETEKVFYKKKEQSPRARFVWSIIVPPDRVERNGPPPQKYTLDNSSVQSRNNWYDVGHILGLNLGGNDDKENFVLQAPTTNESGAWRTMERTVNTEAKNLLNDDKNPQVILFSAAIDYTENPKNVYEVYIYQLKLILIYIQYRTINIKKLNLI